MNDPVLMPLLGRDRPIAPDEHQRWFAGLAGRADCRFFAIETVDGGMHVGNIWLWGIDPRHHRAEVRIVLGPDAIGQGLGAEAMALLARYAFDEQQLHRLYAFVLASNPRARRAFERAGFRMEAVLRDDRWAGDRYVDVYLLARLEGDPA